MSTEMSPVRTVNRICDILNLFSDEEPVLTLTVVSRRLGLPVSTTHRLLTALEQQGFLTREVHGRGYQLGFQLLHWGMVAQTALDLRNEALPILRSLSEATGETVILSVRDGSDGMCVEKVESSQPMRLSMRVGQRLHLNAGASAKVLWAFLPEIEIQRIMNCIEFVGMMPNTITDRQKMREELAWIRTQGYALSFEETDPSAMGIAAPVCDYTGQVVAGIGIAAPIARIPFERVPEVTPLVLEASHRLCLRLGGTQKSIAALSAPAGR